MRQLVAGARARLAELEVDHAKEKSRIDAMQAVLFRRLREHYQERDRLRLVVDYRRKYLDSLVRGGEEEAKRAEENYKKAKARTEKDYEETAAAVAEKKPLTAGEEAELTRLWKKLVKLYHPDRFADQPDKLETYKKLTSAINRAKDNGDIAALREIANAQDGSSIPVLEPGERVSDTMNRMDRIPFGTIRYGILFIALILSQSSGTPRQPLQLEIIAVLESLNRLRESLDFELCQLSEQKPGMLDELAAERTKLLEKECAELERQAERLAEEIKELSGQETDRIA